MPAHTVNRSHQVAFQTGAHYTSHGQRIAAWIEPNREGQREVACFVDFDRAISGYFPVRTTFSAGSLVEFARHVRHMYDWGQYWFSMDTDGLRTSIGGVYADGYEAFVRGPAVQVLPHPVLT